MAFKLLTSLVIACLVSVVLSDSSGFYKKECGSDQACVTSSEKCLGELLRKPAKKNETEKAPVNKLAAFNQCLDQNGQGSSKIKESDCASDGVKGKLVDLKKPQDKCRKEISAYMTTKEERIVGPIRCCYVRAIGPNKYTHIKLKSDGNMDVDSFKAYLKERVTDQGTHRFYETAFTKCLPQGANCNLSGFRKCMFTECLASSRKLN